MGWVHFAQGRFSKFWGEAQGLYYQMNPDLKVKKHLTGLNWAKVMIGALIDMSLAMWKNRCDSLHGNSEKEKVQKKKDKLKGKLEWCYNNSHKIPEQYHILFRKDINTLCQSRSPYYLEQWISTFQAYSDQALRERTSAREMLNLESKGTFDTEDVDMEEYWVDVNDGMDMEDQMAFAGIKERDISTVSSDGGKFNIEPKPPW